MSHIVCKMILQTILHSVPCAVYVSYLGSCFSAKQGKFDLVPGVMRALHAEPLGQVTNWSDAHTTVCAVCLILQAARSQYCRLGFGARSW